jgi:hypothetical protein
MPMWLQLRLLYFTSLPGVKKITAEVIKPLTERREIFTL